VLRRDSTRGSLFQVAKPNYKRRDVYGLMTERCDAVLKNFKKEEE
jgi:hypothetical protein